MKFLSHATRNLFFTGKGGVGKTSLACATAVGLADRGKRVLLVSTDPASNLDEVLGVSLGSQSTAIPDVPGLLAMNLDADQAASEYRERLVGPYRGVLPETVVASMEEQLSGSCTVEIAAFDEFSRLLGDPKTTAEFDHVVFDTAPTGHTLRLLSLPAAWSGFIDANTSGTSCLGPLAGLQAQHQLYKDTVQALSGPQATTLVLVSRAERSALAEAERSSGELAALGVRNQHLVVNAVFRAQRADDPIARAMQQRGQDALAAIPKGLTEFPRTELPLAPHNLIGVAALRAMLQGTRDAPYLAKSHSSHLDVLPPTLADVIDQIAPTTHAPALTGTTVVVSQSAQGLLAPGQRRNIDHDKVARNAKMAGRAGFSVGMRRRWSVGNDCAFSSAITKPSSMALRAVLVGRHGWESRATKMRARRTYPLDKKQSYLYRKSTIFDIRNEEAFDMLKTMNSERLGTTRTRATGTVDADKELARLAKALGHPLRVKIVRLLANRTNCVCGELVDELPVAQSTVSQHVKILKEAGLIRGTIDRPRVCYCLAPGALQRLKGLVNSLPEACQDDEPKSDGGRICQ